MLNTATTLGRSGLQDWLIQRLSAVVLAIYTLTLLVFWLSQPVGSILIWQKLFANIFMKYATLLALLSLIAHSWIGLWTISTDYLQTTWLRLCFQIAIFILLLFYLIWGVQILWG